MGAQTSLELQALLKLMTDINAELLEGTILRDCIGKVRMCSPKFSDALKETIRLHLAELDAKINESQAQVRYPFINFNPSFRQGRIRLGRGSSRDRSSSRFLFGTTAGSDESFHVCHGESSRVFSPDQTASHLLL